ncbi:hypothetical protein U1Q18_014525 [Sarracenia purpurea var. burkii]
MNEDIDVVPGENPIAVGTEEGGAKDHQVFSVPSFAFSSEFSLDPAGVCIEDVGLTRSSVFASREKQTAEKPLHGDKLISGAIVSSLEKKVSGSDDGEGSKVVASSGEQGDAGLATMMTEKLPKANSAVFFKTPAAVQPPVGLVVVLNVDYFFVLACYCWCSLVFCKPCMALVYLGKSDV